MVNLCKLLAIDVDGGGPYRSGGNLIKRGVYSKFWVTGKGLLERRLDRE